MTYSENSELFKAVLAVAGADGTFTRAETGLLNSLAERIGIGGVSLQAMMAAAADPDYKARLLAGPIRQPVRALELLVAAARIDGEITEAERQMLLHVAESLKIPPDASVAAFERGLATADRLRADRRNSGSG